MRVTGSELVGLVPLSVLTDAGRHYLRRMGRSAGVSEAALVAAAVRTLGLSEVKPFDPAERVIEYKLATKTPLASMTLQEFADELASDSPAPGGGSVSALAGSLGAGLAAMVANLSHAKQGFEEKQERLEAIAVEGQQLKAQLMAAVDADTAAFDAFMDAMRLPKDTPEQKSARKAAMTEATIAAIEIPLGVLEACPRVIELCIEIAEIGLQASLSDAGVGAQVARAAAAGAFMNVCINMPSLDDETARRALLRRADQAWERSRLLHDEAELTILANLRKAAER